MLFLKIFLSKIVVKEIRSILKSFINRLISTMAEINMRIVSGIFASLDYKNVLA